MENQKITEDIFAACENSLDSCLKVFNLAVFEGYNPDIITIVFKQKLLQIVSDNESELVPELGKSILNFDLLFGILDLSIELSKSQETLQSLTFLLIEDLIDVLTVKNAEKIFDFIYSRFDKLSENLEPNKGKGLIILRICNEFLKRVSKLENAETCGKILILLSQIFPISDQSGINKKGEFNTENKTVFHRNDDTMDVENDSYNYFWELQFYFSNPTILLEPSNFVEFEKRIDSVFKHLELVQQQTANVKTKRKADNLLGSISESFHFFPKYLTSKNLFELELNDPFFKRQFILQFLIISNFILDCNESKTSIANKSVQFLSKLNTAQVEWLNQSKQRAIKILDKITPQSRLFARSVQSVLGHEKNWVAWKKDSCKVYEKESFVENDLDTSRRKKRRLKGSQASIPNFLGNDEMTLLWEKGGRMRETLREQNLASNLTSEDMIAELNQQLDQDLETPLNGIEEEYLLFHQMGFNWLAHRLAVKDHLCLFAGNIEFDSLKPGKSLLKAWRCEKAGNLIPSSSLDQLDESVRESQAEVME